LKQNIGNIRDGALFLSAQPQPLDSAEDDGATATLPPQLANTHVPSQREVPCVLSPVLAIIFEKMLEDKTIYGSQL
jgi:hypothetical protein